MKKIIAIALCLAMLMCAAACGETNSPDISEYILETEYKSDYRILQLTDIHLANKDNRQLHFDFLNLTISEANADMIVLDGDNFTFADKAVAKDLFAFIDSYGIPWCITFGNHDEQCYFSVDWLTKYLNNYGSNCLFKDIHNDDVFGYANYAVNLMEDGKVKEQVILFDSNRYYYGSYQGYDWIRDDQIEWYEKLVKHTTSENGATVPSICFFHIPFPEFQTAWDEAEKGSPDAILEYGEMGEPCSCPKYNSGLFDKMLELGSTKAVCCGHDHVNNSRILYKGIYLIYGINSDDRIYYNANMMGGHVITIHDDNSLSFEHIYHSYEEVK